MTTAAAPAVFPGWPKPTDLKWRRDPTPLPTADGLEQFHEVWRSPMDGLLAIRAWHPGVGWHLSLSHPTRYPTWNEIRDARYALLPDNCTMAMLLPPKGEYVNMHPNCFHLHEMAA